MPNSTLIQGSSLKDLNVRANTESDCDIAIAIFARTRGITHCPTACLLPTQGVVPECDRAALEAHAAALNRLNCSKVIDEVRLVLGTPRSTTAATRQMTFPSRGRDLTYRERSGSERRTEKRQNYHEDFNELSDSDLNLQSSKVYLSTAARARRLEMEATTAGVKQYLRRVISTCERLSKE
jgi:hypothetical protein